jgi:membrane-bound inhibitor of C-type lysozyme
MSSRLAVALLILGIASVVPAVIAAEDPTQRVQFDPATNSAVLKGSVAGYRSLRYLFFARAGQVLSTTYTATKKTLYYNVLQGTRMLRDGSSEDEPDWVTTVTADGDYVIDVYFKSADARRNAEATFALTLTLTNPTVNYRCTDGRLVAVTYVNEPDPVSATLVVAGKSYELPHVVSASGARYSNGKITWWNKGSEASLELNGPLTLCAE